MPAKPPSAKKAASSKNPLGNNIRNAREAKGLTQLELAHKMGLKPSNGKGKDGCGQLSRYESGAKVPKLSTLQRIARVLGMGLTELLNTK